MQPGNNERAQGPPGPLDWLGVLRVRGADAKAFLQGQLSNDVTQLTAARSLLAGYHNPQGRVIALLRLIQVTDDDLLAVLPRELVTPVLTRMSRYVLRARVRLGEDSGQWRIEGAVTAEDPGASGAGCVHRSDGAVQLRLSPARILRLSPAAVPSGPAPDQGPAAAPETLSLPWRRAAIADGEPQVWAGTSEEFVAQMLNLDLLGAIAFDKGCYTGQEVIARAHYRGRVKRRMQRFVSDAPGFVLRPGDSGTLSDGRAFRVVDAVALAAGGCEFLAVTSLPGVAPGTAETAPAATTALAARGLPLPYALPD